MKKIISLVFFISLSLNINVWAQCDVNELTDLLYSLDVHDRIRAAQRIADCNLNILIPVLEERIYDEEYLYAAQRMLFALAKLDSDNLEQVAVDFIENVDNLTLLTPDDPLSSKVYGTQILFNLKNYSTIDYIFQIVERDRPDFNFLTIFLLTQFLDNNDLVQHREYAKIELINYLNTNSDYAERSFVLYLLASSYGVQLIDLILDKAYNEQEWILRIAALKSLLNINYFNSRSVFYERLQDDPHRHIRWEISDSILCYWGEPQDLKKIIDYYPNEPEPIVKKDMQHSSNVFIPPKPHALNWSGMITKLISYTNEMFTYEWIVNTQTRDYYISKLGLLKRQIESRRYKDACTTVNNDLLARIETDLGVNNITIEGYKFLHYYCVYIKENFTQTLYLCQ